MNQFPAESSFQGCVCQSRQILLTWELIARSFDAAVHSVFGQRFILWFATDEFMEDFPAILEKDPVQLQTVIARPCQSAVKSGGVDDFVDAKALSFNFWSTAVFKRTNVT